jgi:hypothetical protein
MYNVVPNNFKECDLDLKNIFTHHYTIPIINLFHCSIYATLFFVGLFHSNAGKNVIYNFS